MCVWETYSIGRMGLALKLKKCVKCDIFISIGITPDLISVKYLFSKGNAPKGFALMGVAKRLRSVLRAFLGGSRAIGVFVIPAMQWLHGL